MNKIIFYKFIWGVKKMRKKKKLVLELDGLLPKVCFDQGARQALGWVHRVRSRHRDALNGCRDSRGMGAGALGAGGPRQTRGAGRAGCAAGAHRCVRQERHGLAGWRAAAGKRALGRVGTAGRHGRAGRAAGAQGLCAQAGPGWCTVHLAQF